MLVSNLQSVEVSGAVRVQATIKWEDCDRSDKLLYFEGERDGQDPRLDPNALLLATFPVAVAHGEKRLAIAGAISPMLRSRLADVHGWWRQWQLASHEIPVIEAPLDDSNTEVREATCSGFLSGGVDSLHMLYRNLQDFPQASSQRIRHALLVQGFDTGFKDEIAQADVYDRQTCNLRRVTDAAGIRLTHVRSNIRELDEDLDFWMMQFHGAALAAIGHALINGFGVARISATYDIPNMAPWGSHPLIDPNYSTERLSILHEGIAFSRLDKVRDLTQWPLALANMRVCTQVHHGVVNCGRCEKCVRTKLEIAACGVDIPLSFKDRGLDPNQLSALTNPYQASCYRELIAPLQEQGHKALASAVRRQVSSFRLRPLTNSAKAMAHQARGLLAQVDNSLTGGILQRTYRHLYHTETRQ
jgi:hypothetical protein